MTGSASISASISLISFSLEISVVVDFGGSVEVVVEVVLVLDDDVSCTVELSSLEMVDEVKVVPVVDDEDSVEEEFSVELFVELSGSLSVVDVEALTVVEVS